MGIVKFIFMLFEAILGLLNEIQDQAKAQLEVLKAYFMVEIAKIQKSVDALQSATTDQIESNLKALQSEISALRQELDTRTAETVKSQTEALSEVESQFEAWATRINGISSTVRANTEMQSSVLQAGTTTRA